MKDKKNKTARKTKETWTGTATVDGEDYKVKGTTKTRRTIGGGERVKNVTKSDELISPIKKKVTVSRYDADGRLSKYKSRKPTYREVSSRDKELREQFKNEDAATMRAGGTLGYEPTAKYGKSVKTSMLMCGGELKKLKKGKK